MSLSTEHVCHSQHLGERKPKRCNCRKKITLAEATNLVEKGFAQWLILDQVIHTGVEVCPICDNQDIKKSCQNCKGTGEVIKTYTVATHSNDIVLVTAGSIEGNKTVYRSVKSKKTPRVATIEKAHIHRAYLDGNKEEQERIEAYGLMTLQTRIDMNIGIEPPDDPKTGTGRNYDYGRSPYAKIADERTSIGAIGMRICKGFVHGTEAESGESVKEREC